MANAGFDFARRAVAEHQSRRDWRDGSERQQGDCQEGQGFKSRMRSRLIDLADKVIAIEPESFDAASFCTQNGVDFDSLNVSAGATSTLQVGHPKALQPATGAMTDEPDCRRLSDEPDVEYEYLWFPYVPCASLTVLGGAGGAGKGTLMLYLASLVTTGRLENLGITDVQEPGNVLIFTQEDSSGKTIKPVIELNGGNSSRILVVRETKSGAAFTMKDEHIFRKAVEQHRPRLVIVDNAGDFSHSETDSYNQKSVVGELNCLVRLANDYDCAVILLVHLNKSGGLMGSQGYQTKPRSVLLLEVGDGEDEHERVLRQVKNNLDGCGQPIGFTTESVAVAGRRRPVAKVRYLGAVLHNGKKKALSKQEQCNDWLRAVLSGGPVPNAALLQDGLLLNFDKSHISRARTAVGAVQKYIDKIRHTMSVFDATASMVDDDDSDQIAD